MSPADAADQRHPAAAAPDPSTAPYSGLRVVELATGVAGEMTGLQAVHFGAEVTKVEPPEGVPSRHHGPFVDDIADPERSLGYWYYNGGKRSVVADLATADGRRRLAELLADADAFIVTLRPAELAAVGLDLDAVAAAHPRLIIVSITPFGLTGPWADYRACDLVTMAASGLLITSGYDDHAIPPIAPGGGQTEHLAASFAQTALLLALHQREVTGAGTVIDVSSQEASGVTVELANPYWFYVNGIVQRQTCRHASPVPSEPSIFRCADGRWVFLALVLADGRLWAGLVTLLERYGYADDLGTAEYAGLAHRQQRIGHIVDRIEQCFGSLAATTVYHEGQALGIPIGVLNAPEDLYADEHLRARDYFIATDQPGFGTVERPAAAYRFSHLHVVPPGPSPRLGEHDQAV